MQGVTRVRVCTHTHIRVQNAEKLHDQVSEEIEAVKNGKWAQYKTRRNFGQALFDFGHLMAGNQNRYVKAGQQLWPITATKLSELNEKYGIEVEIIHSFLTDGFPCDIVIFVHSRTINRIFCLKYNSEIACLTIVVKLL